MIKKYNITLSSILFILFSGLILASFAGYTLHEKENNNIRRDFETDVKQSATSLYRELMINLEIAQALRILFRDDNLPTYDQFNTEATLILNRFEGIHALSWDPKVTELQRQSFELQQQDYLPGFAISEREEQGRMVTAKKRAVYYPILYISPNTGNQTAIGFDLGSNETRLSALMQARNSAKEVATASITLVQGEKQSKAFITFIPVFRWLSSTHQQRQTNLRGYISAVFKIREIFQQAILSERPRGINMKLYDKTVPENVTLLHDHDSRTGSLKVTSLDYTHKLPELWSRYWVLEAQATQYYIDKRKSYFPQSIFVAGSLFTIFICIYLYFVSQQSQKIKQSVYHETRYLNQANKKLKRLSDIDALTEVANRRRMDSYLKQLWRKSLKVNSRISVLLIDIDFFKLYNDNYGHPAGDRVLIQVAQAINSVTLRSDDLTARFGGEEFALILSNTSDVNRVAEQCLKAIRDLGIKHDFSQISEYLSISIGGFTVAASSDKNFETLIRGADNALYQAKSAGRNCIKLIDEADWKVINMKEHLK